jgi:hypothetical protein
MNRFLSGSVRTLSRIAVAIAAVAAAFVLTACPPPVTPALVNIVQDDIAPVVIITSPGNNSSFRSVLTVSGTISDSSVAAADLLGELESVRFEVGGAEYLDRTLLFGTDGTITYDPPERPFTSYDPETGEFSVTFSTAEPLLTGFRQISILATDRKGHETETNITVFAYTDGPAVEITSPVDGDRYESTVTIAGKVTNALGSELVDEIDPEGLSYRIAADTIQILPFDNRPTTDEFFDPETGEFQIIHVFNPLPTGGVVLEVTATDLSGYEGWHPSPSSMSPVAALISRSRHPTWTATSTTPPRSRTPVPLRFILKARRWKTTRLKMSSGMLRAARLLMK